jgi:hypothetical protein
MANVNVSVAGWPAPPGAKDFYVWDHYGPASYVQYSVTGPAGDIINAADLGYGGIDEVSPSWAAYSNSGNYVVQCNPCLANDIPAGSAAKRFTVQWFTTSAAFGSKSTEATAATNLSAEYVRLRGHVV